MTRSGLAKGEKSCSLQFMGYRRFRRLLPLVARHSSLVTCCLLSCCLQDRKQVRQRKEREEAKHRLILRSGFLLEFICLHNYMCAYIEIWPYLFLIAIARLRLILYMYIRFS